MLVAERHREIAALVKRERSVRVRGLAEQFSVTEETIRRDLEKLESDGVVIRSHGGAVAASELGRETHYAERAASNIGEKRAIANRAVKELEPGDTILLDASTTALELARYLPDISLTVLTNSINVCTALSERKTIKVMCIGGALSSASLSFVGPQAEQHLSDYHVHRFFFSCSGVDFEHGLSDINEAQAILKRKMMSIADQSYLLFDQSKLSGKFLQRFCRIDDVDTVITTADIGEPNRQQLRESNVKLVEVTYPG